MKIVMLMGMLWFSSMLAAEQTVPLAQYQQALETIEQLKAEIKRLKGEANSPVADVSTAEPVAARRAAPSSNARTPSLISDDQTNARTSITPKLAVEPAVEYEEEQVLLSPAEEAELSRYSAAEEAELNRQPEFDDAWLLGKHRIKIKRPLVSRDGNLVIKVRETHPGGAGSGICSILLVSDGQAQLKRYAVRDNKQFSFAGHYYRFSVDAAENKACLLSVQRRS